MTNNAEVANLLLSDIKADPACQSRDAMNVTIIEEYAEAMKEKGDDRFPAVVVYHDGTDYWLSDGFHRHAAAQKAGLTTLKARIRQGTKRDAVLHSVGTNTNHGLRRSNADKRRAVTILLKDEEWSTWSNREIARRCAVDEGLVRKVKEDLGLSSSASADCPQIARTVKRNDTVYEMKTGKIGKRDDLDELFAVKPNQDVQPHQPWIVKPDTSSAEEEEIPEDSVGLDGVPVSDLASSTEEVELQELMSAWARASEQVQQQFLATIGVSPVPQVKAELSLTETEPESFTEQTTEPSVTEPPENALFEMWKDYKPNTQVDGRKWVADGCPSDYQDQHFIIKERLKPFRAAALAATQEERAEFLELARTHQAENWYS